MPKGKNYIGVLKGPNWIQRIGYKMRRMNPKAAHMGRSLSHKNPEFVDTIRGTVEEKAQSRYKKKRSDLQEKLRKELHAINTELIGVELHSKEHRVLLEKRDAVLRKNRADEEALSSELEYQRNRMTRRVALDYALQHMGFSAEKYGELFALLNTRYTRTPAGDMPSKLTWEGEKATLVGIFKSERKARQFWDIFTEKRALLSAKK